MREWEGMREVGGDERGGEGMVFRGRGGWTSDLEWSWNHDSSELDPYVMWRRIFAFTTCEYEVMSSILKHPPSLIHFFFFFHPSPFLLDLLSSIFRHQPGMSRTHFYPSFRLLFKYRSSFFNHHALCFLLLVLFDAEMCPCSILHWTWGLMLNTHLSPFLRYLSSTYILLIYSLVYVKNSLLSVVT